MRAAVVQTVIVAALLVAQNVPQPQVNSGVADQVGGTYAVPLAVFLATAISIAVAYCLALAGALRVRAAAGLPIVAATTIALAAIPVAKLRVGGADIGPHATEVRLRWAQLAVLAILWLWALGRKRRPGAPRWHGLTFAGVLTVIAAYYVLEAGVWASYARAGQAAAGTGFLLDDLSFQAVLLPIFLTLVILLGSTDLLEWGEITARWAAARVREARPGLLLTLTLLAALAVVANVVRLALARRPETSSSSMRTSSAIDSRIRAAGPVELREYARCDAVGLRAIPLAASRDGLPIGVQLVAPGGR